VRHVDAVSPMTLPTRSFFFTRRYKSQKWRDRLLNDAEKKAAEEKKEALRRQTAAMVQNASRGRRGGTTFG